MSLKLKNYLGFQQPAEKVSIQSTDWRQNDGGSNKSRTLKRKPRRFMLKKHPTCHPFCLLLHLQNEMVVFFRFVTSCHGKPVDSERKAELSSSWSIVWRLPCRPPKTGQKSILDDLFTLTWVYIIVLEVDLWEIMEMYPFLAANVRQHHVKCWRDRCKRFFSGRFSP